MTGVQPAPWTLDMTSVIFEFDLTSGAGDEGRLWWRHNLLALWTLWSSPPAQQRALFVSGRELGGGEEDVPRSCSLLAAEGHGRLERLRAFPAEPWLRADAARLRLCLLLLCAALCWGTTGVYPEVIPKWAGWRWASRCVSGEMVMLWCFCVSGARGVLAVQSAARRADTAPQLLREGGAYPSDGGGRSPRGETPSSPAFFFFFFFFSSCILFLLCARVTSLKHVKSDEFPHRHSSGWWHHQPVVSLEGLQKKHVLLFCQRISARILCCHSILLPAQVHIRAPVHSHLYVINTWVCGPQEVDHFSSYWSHEHHLHPPQLRFYFVKGLLQL